MQQGEYRAGCMQFIGTGTNRYGEQVDIYERVSPVGVIVLERAIDSGVHDFEYTWGGTWMRCRACNRGWDILYTRKETKL
jgi:hypothetical protein